MFELLVALICAYIYFVQSQYYVGIGDSVSWFDAEEACRTGVYILATNGKLATWDDYDTYNNKVKPALVGDRAWIGLNDLGNGEYGGSGSEGDWHFIDGRNCGGSCLSESALGSNGLSEWSPGEPNDYGDSGEDCAEIWNVDDQAGNPNGLNDRNCDTQQNFICEFTTLITPSGVGKQDIDIPIINPLNNPSGGDYYIMEFTSFKDILFFATIVLNVILISTVFYLGSKPRKGRYSKMNMYATEDEKL